MLPLLVLLSITLLFLNYKNNGIGISQELKKIHKTSQDTVTALSLQNVPMTKIHLKTVKKICVKLV